MLAEFNSILVGYYCRIVEVLAGIFEVLVGFSSIIEVFGKG